VRRSHVQENLSALGAYEISPAKGKAAVSIFASGKGFATATCGEAGNTSFLLLGPQPLDASARIDASNITRLFTQEKADNVRDILDLTPREVAVFAPLVILTLWMGVYPASFTGFWDASVGAMVEHHQAALATAVKLAGVLH